VGDPAKPVVREKATWSVRKGGLDVVVGWF